MRGNRRRENHTSKRTTCVTLTESIYKTLRDYCLKNEKMSAQGLFSIFRLLAKWRSTLIAQALTAQNHTKVMAGPFAGLDLQGLSAEGCFTPKLLGVYESALHPFIEELCAFAPDVVVNLGCAEGYYAVGLARRLPDAQVIAVDKNEACHTVVEQLAKANDAAGRVSFLNDAAKIEWPALAGKRIGLFIDVEGAETELLGLIPLDSFAGVCGIVETHTPNGGSATLPACLARLAAFNPVPVTPANLRSPDFAQRHFPDELDLLLCTWEWRETPTPWLFFKN